MGVALIVFGVSFLSLRAFHYILHLKYIERISNSCNLKESSITQAMTYRGTELLPKRIDSDSSLLIIYMDVYSI